MSLRVDADAYWRFIGRYSEKLAAGFADYAGVEHGQTALDVGCGPGGLTAVLVERLGSAHVAALDPGEPFVEAARTRLPGGDIRLASAESIPFDDEARMRAEPAERAVHRLRERLDGVRDRLIPRDPGRGPCLGT